MFAFRFYIAYQIMIMVGTVLGPGTIFLMLIGALNAALGISNNTALIFNLVLIMYTKQQLFSLWPMK